MRIVVLDGYAENPGDLSWDGIRALGDTVIYDRTPTTDAAQIAARIGGAEIVVTNKTPLSRAVLDACPAVRYIAVLATGYNVVDIDAARERGIWVSNVPGYGTAAVAQHAIALLLELTNSVGCHDRTVHEGKWAACPDFCYWDRPIIELDGKTLGVIGFGRIGQAVAGIAAALGMRVLACGGRAAPGGIAHPVELDTLLGQSDVISLHCNLTAENTGMIDRSAIGKMKDGAILINTARGQLLNEKDVAEALRSGKLGAVGLDVVSAEPVREDNPLLSAPNCLITPHIAWAAKESRQRIMDSTEENIRAFLAGEPRNVVNL